MRTRRAVSAAILILLATNAGAQTAYDEAVGGLSSSDAKVRLRSAARLGDGANVQAAIPLAKLIGDPDSAVQLEAISAEISLFTAGRSRPKRVGILTIEDRTRPVSQQVFETGPLILSAVPSPAPVLLALRLATRDHTPQVSLAAIYAFGALAPALSGRARSDLLQASSADFTSLLNLPDPATRLAAIRVIGRVYDRRPGDPPMDPQMGSLLIAAVNESNRGIRVASMDALGAIRDRRAVEGLTRLSDYYGDSNEGQAALGALARIGDKSSVPVFLKQLSGKSTPLKILAIEGLARAGDASHIPAIQEALNREGDPRVFDAGLFAGAMLINGSIDGLIESLNRPKSHDLARQYLVDVARGHTAWFVKYTQDPAPRVRMDVADILALADDPRGVPVVTAMTKDMDPQVAASATRAVAWLTSER